MAFAPSLHSSSISFRSSSSPPSTKHLFFAPPPNPRFLSHRPYISMIVFSRRRNTHDTITSSKKHKQNLRCNDAMEDDSDEDAFETLFKQLEEDLQNDDLSSNDSDEEISEEDLVKLEHELNEVLRDDELLVAPNSTVNNTETDSGVEEYDESDDEERQVTLKNWQLRRLASALKIGRRKTNIKSLAADVCLDRAVVLQLLREPPPNLLLISAALPDEPMPANAEPETQPEEIVHVQTHAEAREPEAKAKAPVHVMRSQWSAQKRLKKVQVETLERVYQRTKRPTDAMISSVVNVTNLPRRRVLKWFEDKRAEDGVPYRYLPYRRWSTSETASTE